jgi:spore coat protein U-like protein
MKSKLLVAATAIALGLAAGANAAQNTTTFAVTATVTKACTISATALSFGSFNVLSGSNVDASSSVTATCTNGSGYSIGLDAGSGSGATVGARKMTHDTDNTKTLNYGLFLDSGRSTNWDDIGGTNVLADTGSGVAQAFTVYGRVPSGQTSPIVGAYSDTVTVTIDF